jgi:hypothetical protein
MVIKIAKKTGAPAKTNLYKCDIENKRGKGRSELKKPLITNDPKNIYTSY